MFSRLEGVRQRGRWLFCVAALGVLGGCEPARPAGPTRPPTVRSEPVSTEYTLSVDPDLTRLDATVCMHGYRARRVEAPTERAESLVTREPRSHAGCLRYQVDLALALSVAAGLTTPRRVGQSLLVSPDLWLWEPEGRPPDTPTFASFVATGDQTLAVPWPELGANRFLLPQSQFSLPSQAAMGQLERRTFQVPGAGYDVVTLGGALGALEPRVQRWLEQAASADRQLFPASRGPNPLVLLVRERERSSPFGYAVRGGGPTVTELLPREPSVETLRNDWTLIHELVHVRLPDVRQEDAWFHEGIATYYTYLLRARIGAISAERAWANLFDGFARGARTATGHTLAYDSRHMHEQHAYRRVYWAGAAFVSAAEIELGKRGRSFDDAVRELSRCCLDQREHSARELLAHLDTWLGEALLVPLSEEHLARSNFPDTRTLAKWFGVHPTGVDSCRFDASAPGARMREALSSIVTGHESAPQAGWQLRDPPPTSRFRRPVKVREAAERMRGKPLQALESSTPSKVSSEEPPTTE